VSLMPWGTPKQVLEKIAYIREVINPNGFLANLSYAGMPYPEAERNLRCFAEHVMPQLQRLPSVPLAEPPLLDIRAA